MTAAADAGLGRPAHPADTGSMKPKGMTWTDSSWLFLIAAVILLFARGLA